MPKIKVLVVDDSAFMRKVITDIINSSPDMEVVGRARDGLNALAQIHSLNPDVITLDIEMPVMDGLEALDRIMKEHPLPVVMLSSLTKDGTEQTVKALQLGAVDFIPKPSGQISLDITQISEEIIRKIQIAAGTRKKLQNLYRGTDITPGRNSTPIDKWPLDPAAVLKKIVLIGTSTGGPKALHQVIPSLPRTLGAGILIVQHMPPGFTKSLAERLDGMSQVKVKEAEQGEIIVPGCAYIAPGDYHLTVAPQINHGEKQLLIALNQLPPRGGHRPSVNVMLESVAQHFWGQMVCVIMTGMGNDGAGGLTLIKERGGRTIAEDQSTSIVYGMPKAAVETGRVDRVVVLNKIGAEITTMLQ
ncbi:MAG TPA: chemotaxis response regulator protein-glutamate methylesterase [Syntrophomonadaceae bacterium]|nr:chemotaxis response regulator protein-glutamate methylesterase [Syntrophomonadaceae bacterium]